VSSAGPSRLELALLRDRLWVAAGLGLAVALAWAWVVPAARDMYGEMNGLSAWMMVASWDARYFGLVFAMWVVMMVGMMLPSAAPTLVLFGRVARSGPAPDAGMAPMAPLAPLAPLAPMAPTASTAPISPVARVYAFAAGYLLAWTGFSLAATTLQWGLSEANLLTTMMEPYSATFAGALLIIAGAYQLTPFKRSCLTRCRTPASFLAGRFRPGRRGALRMGWEHGLYCLGCCWGLMLLLFAGGVMNLTCIAAITVFVLLEKLAPFGVQGGRLSGVLLLLGGVWLVVRS
jgi:predicted metal-binding membrane protein